jgi:hypothetical protein
VEAKETMMETLPLGPLMEPDERLLEKWRQGEPIGKQELLILVLSGLVLLIGILVGIMVITSDLLEGIDADQAAIRNGMEQRLGWFGETPNLTDSQHTRISTFFEDGHNQVFAFGNRIPRMKPLTWSSSVKRRGE